MAEYQDSILMNGYAELGNTSGWQVLNTSIVNDAAYGGRHFYISPTGYMMQDIPLTLVAKTSATYELKLSYYRHSEINFATPDIQANAEVIFRYEDGIEDVHTFPFQGFANEWYAINETVDARDASLTDVVIRITNPETSGAVRLDNLSLRPSKELADTDDDGGNYDNFREKSILFGLESDLPKLGGY